MSRSVFTEFLFRLSGILFPIFGKTIIRYAAPSSAYYARFADQAAFRELIASIAEDLERVWQAGKQKKEEDS